ncbi:hypothetical protein COT63_01865 [Candidatus Shapirobacteria bacterium CG09_land_8_20_14_0_10_38_17]|uniref:Uncharacterized protein n=1 Tax=Candidatus Shapirobacteria bacterium CG09_land_8_20_14_0_10_38_17 TaxID=1974884 RepID=A0A2H0WR21_9BACT|nr:MAG: hypothetical protein COT63_01865 [Candidatus Shapirobacteria bacterium CG09_land_8_20_14_0_10_38_17]
MKKILVTITTTDSSWRQKIEEIDKLNIKEAALFLTGLNFEERKECYSKLKKTGLKKIPFVHLRSDMTLKEIEFLIKNYQTKAFNIHSEKEFPLKYNLSSYSKQIYLENSGFPLTEEEIKKWVGVCLDLSHLEDDRNLNSSRYKKYLKLLEKYPIGANHISAVRKKVFNHPQFGLVKSAHFLKTLNELDYLKNFPKDFFAPLIAIELENSLKEQLKIKEYLETFIS